MAVAPQATPLAGFTAGDRLTQAQLAREDDGADPAHYVMPRFGQALDDGARYTLRENYAEAFEHADAALGGRPLDVLDVGASWVSHYNEGMHTFGRVVGVGMNEMELARNGHLSEFFVQDLNARPALTQFCDGCFDVVTMTAAAEYFTRPYALFAELLRVLRPGGLAMVAFTTRSFTPAKAVAAWREAGDDDARRARIVGGYFHFSSGGEGSSGGDAAAASAAGDGGYYAWSTPEWLDASPFPGHSDALHIVRARKVPAPRG
jgi:SAM-dependent methyltransferase